MGRARPGTVLKLCNKAWQCTTVVQAWAWTRTMYIYIAWSAEHLQLETTHKNYILIVLVLKPHLLRGHAMNCLPTVFIYYYSRAW
jgi:hypothetical protein